MTAPTAIGLRFATALVVLLGVTFVVFMLLHWVPGDAVDFMLGDYAAAADRAALRAHLGLDLPLLQQWLRFLGGVLRGDLGDSLASGRPVLNLVAEHGVYTAMLALSALILAVLAGVPLGVAAALHAGRLADTVASVGAVFAMSAPSFVLGPLLIIVFALRLRWLPVSGADGPAALVLPAVTLAAPLAAVLARMTRAALLDVLHEPYIVAARARGLSEARVIIGHACRAAAPLVVTVIGLQLGALLGGAVITESVFSWPGIGQLAIEAIQHRDYPVMQACVLVISVSYILVNAATDSLSQWLDPRMSDGQ